MNSNLIINHNVLDTAIYKMTPVELKLMHYCITKVRRDGGYSEKNRLFEIRHEDFASLIGQDNCYNTMKAAVSRLQQQIVIINEPITDADGVTHRGGAINVLSAQYWAENEGYIKLEFSDRFMPYLTKLAGDYNKLFFNDIAHMKSEYSIRLYKLVRMHYNKNKSYGHNDNLLIEVDTLREIFKLGDKYKVNYEFKRKVIDKATTEINQHSPLNIEYNQVKKGRRIYAYSFKITAKASEFAVPVKKKRRTNEQIILDKIESAKKALGAGLSVSIKDNKSEHRIVKFEGDVLASLEDGTTCNIYSLLKEKKFKICIV